MNIPKNNDILKQLYHGDISPVESVPLDNPAYAQTGLKINETIEALEKTIPSQQQYLLEYLQELFSEQNMIELEFTFEQGVRIGTQIMLAVQEKELNDITISIFPRQE